MKKERFRFDRDEDGLKYSFPERSCDWCDKRPCLKEFESYDVDFAKYGCVDFKEVE